MIIAEKSGHKSLKALWMYKRTSSVQEQATGVAIINGEQASSDGELEENSGKKPNMDMSGQGKSQISPPQLPTFTGNLSNCTININFN